MAQLDEIKKILRSLLVSAPVKVTVSSLNRDYKSLEGRNIPYRELGFNSLLHLLHSIPDVLRVNGSSFESEVILIITDKVAHVSDMVMKQKKPTKGRNAYVGRKSVIQDPLMNTHISEKSVASFKNDSTKKFTNNIETPPSQSYLDVRKELSPFPKPLLSKERNLLNFTKHKTPIQNTELTSNDNNKNTSASKTKGENCRAYTNNVEPLTKTLSSNCERVPSLLKHMPHNDVKQTSIEEQYSGTQSKLGRLRMIRLRNKNGENDNEIESNNIPVTEENDIKDIITFENEDNKIPVRLQNELKKLIKLYPGIRCTELPLVYKKMYHKNLDYQIYGFDRLISLCMNLDRIFHCEEDSDWDFKLYDKDNPPLLESKLIEEKSNQMEKTNFIMKNIDISKIKGVKSKDWDIYEDSIPEDSLKLGEVIENNSLDEFIIEETIQVVISEIYNPSKFWIYRNDGNLNEMMNSMQFFYMENKAKYVIPEFLIDVGLYCVVHTLEEFQRAIIIDLLQDIGGYVKVFLIDYGTLTNLSRDKVWFLSKQFCVLPAQAVETNLAGIEPREEVWTKESIIRFKDMIVSKYIFARILDKCDQTLSVNITVMNKPLETLNDLLVQEGYAKYIGSCKLQDGNMSDLENTVEETNTRRKLIERLRLKNRMKHN